MSTKNNRKRLARINRDADLYGLQPLSRKRWRQIKEILGNACLKCGAQPVTRDHVVPIARGGLNHPANLQPLCKPCNNGKRDEIADYRTPDQRALIFARWPLNNERAPIEQYTRSMSTPIAELL